MDCSIQAALSYAIISWVCLNSWPLSQWCYPTISSSATPFSLCLQSFPASESFPMSQLLGGHLASVLPKNIHGWFPLGLTSLISLQLKVLSKVFSSTTILKHQFFGAQLSLWSNSHILTWPLEKITWAPKSLQMVTAAMKLSLLLFGRKDMTNLDGVLKSRDMSLQTKVWQFSSVQSPSCIWLCVTQGTEAHQASPSITNSQGSLKLMFIELVMPSNHLILCCLLLLPSIFPSIMVFSSESVLCFRYPKYWSFSFGIRTSNDYSGLISFRIECLDLLAVQGTLKSLLQHHSSKASVFQHSA